MFFFYEEQLLWVLDTFSGRCQTPAIASYLAHAAPRLEELALLPLGAGGRDQAKYDHLDRVMADLVASPLHVLGLVHRLVELLPGVITSLETCDLEEEARLVRGMLQGGKDRMESGDMSGAIRAVTRIQFVYK